MSLFCSFCDVPFPDGCKCGKLKEYNLRVKLSREVIELKKKIKELEGDLESCAVSFDWISSKEAVNLKEIKEYASGCSKIIKGTFFDDKKDNL